jgi:uncharacterized protein (DUF433 family)/DNA-binding transcriptional MerR regulator
MSIGRKNGLGMRKTRGRQPAAIGSYTAADVARLAGVSTRRIGSWARYGIIPSVSPKKPRLYSYADAGEAVLARYLIEQGRKPKEIRQMVERLREEYGEWPLATAPLEHEGRLIVTREEGRVLIDAVDHPGHHVAAGTFVDLKQVRHALERGGWVAIRRPREHIQVDPERLSGQPVVRGRRVSTETVADLAQRPEGRALLVEDYGLTDEEITEAVEYESDVSEALAA